MSYKVITHNGKAHMDELLGIALLSIHFDKLPTEIIRMEHDEAAALVKNSSLSDDKFYIDCGYEYNPSNNIFDHHHSKEVGSSALLIFDFYFSHLTGSSIHDYIKLVSLVDTKGPTALDEFKYNSDTITYFSFPQSIILKEFEKNPLLITELFYNGIKSRINFEEDKIAANKWLKIEDNFTITDIDSIKVLVFSQPPPYELSNAVKSVSDEIVENNNIHAIYGWDKDDNSIRTLYRTLKGNNVLDFSLSNVKDVTFCHKGGFLLKFRPHDENEWEIIIKESEI